MNRYCLYGSSDDNIHCEGELIDLAKYFQSLQHSVFYRLAILDRETQQLIRWDRLMAQTWFYPLGETCQLLGDWFQAMAIAKLIEVK